MKLKFTSTYSTNSSVVLSFYWLQNPLLSQYCPAVAFFKKYIIFSMKGITDPIFLEWLNCSVFLVPYPPNPLHKSVTSSCPSKTHCNVCIHLSSCFKNYHFYRKIPFPLWSVVKFFTSASKPPNFAKCVWKVFLLLSCL